jgi:hypothetical protein
MTKFRVTRRTEATVILEAKNPEDAIEKVRDFSEQYWTYQGKTTTTVATEAK